MPRKSPKSRAKSLSIHNRFTTKVQLAPQADGTNSNKLHFDKIICGTFHQGDERFSINSLGRQCSCNALISLAYIQHLEVITSAKIDEILVEGDAMYKSIYNKLLSEDNIHPSGYLTTENLPTEFSIGTFNYIVTYYDGLTDQLGNPSDESSRLGLDIAVHQAFSLSNSSILVLGNSMVALCKCQSENYAVFDPHSRNHLGLVGPHGTAVLMYFSSIQTIIDYLYFFSKSVGFQESMYFEIKPLSITCQLETQFGLTNMDGYPTLASYFNDQISRNKHQQTKKATIGQSMTDNPRKAYFRKKKKEQRQNAEMRAQERIRDKRAKQSAMLSQSNRTKHQLCDKQSKRIALQNKDKQNKYRVRNRQLKQIALQDEEKRNNHQIIDRRSKHIALQNKHKRYNHRVQDRRSKDIALQNEVKREKHRVSDRLSKQIALQNEEKRNTHRVSDRRSKKIALQNVDKRNKHRVSDRRSKKIALQNVDKRNKHRVSDRLSKKTALQNVDKRNKHRVSDRRSKQVGFQDKAKRDKHRATDRRSKQIAMQNKETRENYRKANKETKRKSRMFQNSTRSSKHESFLRT
ncbi:hypothetical protein HOLleu_01147 [Holothuria leucospilota]|uniref:Peptidase C76 domain-containing protein n=1 Tax=Holothuria leucospilota TaxID=206669 RepID=A0A9Q1HG87_HOLLE|nr:hypothetical protein HOLleu_01147 [Holothuria leucospilota]